MDFFMMRFISLLVLAFTATLHAQKASGGDLKVRFLAERTSAEIGQVILATEKFRGTPFDLPINHLSTPLDIPARQFSLRSVAKDVSLVNITLPENGKSFIILLIPSPTGGFKPVVISSDDPAFKPGDVYFYNHADKTVLGYVGTAKFILEPTKGTILRPEGAREGKFYDVGMGVREKEGDRALSTTRWPVDDKIRSYVFFFINPKTKQLDFRAVDEFVRVAAPANP